MKFLECNPEHFGKLNGKKVTFSEGINVLTGPNEAGKTTLYRFLQGMLFGIEHTRGRGAKDSTYTKYKPWDTPGAYQGMLDVEVGGKKYHIERDFLQTEGGLKITRIDTGRTLPLNGEFFETIGSPITETGFVNTVMQPQGGAVTDKELAAHLQNAITNMSMAKSRSVDVGGAIEKLNADVKAIDKKGLSEQIASLEKSIEDDEITRVDLERMNTQWSEQSARLTEIEEQIEQLEKDDAPEVEQEFLKQQGRYEHYCDDIIEEEEREADLEAKKTKLKETEAIIVPPESIQKELDEWELAEDRMDAAKAEWDAEKKLAAKKCDEAKATKRYLAPVVLACIVLAGLGAFLLYRKMLWCIIPFALMLLTLSWYLIRNRMIAKRISDLEKELRSISENQPAEYISAEEALAALPPEEESREKERRNIEAIARAQQLRELIAEREERIERSRAELTSERLQLLEFYRSHEPLMEELSEGDIRRITGSIMARSVEQRENLKTARVERDELTRQVARLEQALETADTVEERLSDNRNRVKKLKEEQADDALKAEALNIAMATIHTIAQDIHDSYGKKLNARMSEIAESVTAGHYTHITMDENLKVKVGHKGHSVELEKLSSGTMEQLYLTERLSVGETMYEESLPLVFDDSFVYYDKERLRETLKLLSGLDRQIIICTCTDREEMILNEMKIPYNRIEM